MLISNEPPELPLALLSQTEKAEAQIVQMVLRSLRDYTRSFNAAISLRNFCAMRRDKTQPVLLDWGAMAKRDGAHILSCFGSALDNLTELKRTPALKAMVDASKCKAACRSFASAFPSFDRTVRMFGIDDVYRGSPFAETEGPDSHTVTIRYSGKTVRYQLSDVSLSALIEIKNLVYEAFPTSASSNDEFRLKTGN